MNQQDINNRLK